MSDQFKLSEEPLFYQISVRIENLMTVYTQKEVLDGLEYVTQNNNIQDFIFDDESYIFDRHNKIEMLYIQSIQIIRSYGKEFVKVYVKDIFRKVG